MSGRFSAFFGRTGPWVLLTALTLALTGCHHWQVESLRYDQDDSTVLRVDGVDLHYKVRGPQGAETVLMLHGFGSSMGVWDPIASALQQHYQLVLVDLAGFGRSSRYEGDYSPETQARLLTALLDELRVERTHIVAHSLGAIIALTLAQQQPERVDRLALMGPWVYEEQIPWALRAARQPGLGEITFGLWFAEHLDQRFAMSFYDPEALITEDMLDRARGMLGLRGSQPAALAVLRDLALKDRQRSYGLVDSRTILIQGEDDRIARPDFTRRLLHQMPNARMEAIPYCGHFPMVEAPERVTQLVRNHLNGESTGVVDLELEEAKVTETARQERPQRLRLPVVPVGEILQLDGYFRTRGAMLHNLDLDRGTTPSTGEPIFPYPLSGGEVLGTLDARLRLDLRITVGDIVSAKVRVDALDGLVLGSTPEGFPGTRWSRTPWGSSRQLPQTSGINAFVDSIRLKEAYGEVMTPFGLLAFGRMDLPTWGLGVVSGPDEDLDDDFDDPVDRIAFATSLGNHLIGMSFDVNAVGPTSSDSHGSGLASGQAIDLELQDNLFTVSGSVVRFHDAAAVRRRGRANKTTFSYGLFGSYRWQMTDWPTYYLDGISSEDLNWAEEDAVARRLRAGLVDLWLRLHVGPVRLELEAVYGHATVDDPSLDPAVRLPALTADQFGGVFEVEVEPVKDRVAVELGLGLASGDDAPGLGVAPPFDQLTSQAGDLDGPQFHFPDDTTVNNFRFHPNFQPDLIFWSRIVGGVSDTFYVRPQLRLTPSERFEFTVSGLFSQVLKATSTPTSRLFLGGELDLALRVMPTAGFETRLEYGLFLPGPALNSVDGSFLARPAQSLRLVGAVKW